MKAINTRQRRFIVFSGFFVLAFALYGASEAGSGLSVAVIVAAMIALMGLAVHTG